MAANQFPAGARKAEKVRNLELKVRCPSAEALDALMSQAWTAVAVYIRTMGQRDVYLRAQCGRLRTCSSFCGHSSRTR